LNRFEIEMIGCMGMRRLMRERKQTLRWQQAS